MELAEINNIKLTEPFFFYGKMIKVVRVTTLLVYCGDVREIETYLN